MATALSWVEMAAVKQSGSSCFCAAVADTVETTMETAVAASKPQEPEASTPPVLILLRFFSLPLHLLLPFPFFLFPQAVFIYFINAFTVIDQFSHMLCSPYFIMDSLLLYEIKPFLPALYHIQLPFFPFALYFQMLHHIPHNHNVFFIQHPFMERKFLLIIAYFFHTL